METIDSFLMFIPFIGFAGFLFALATYAWILRQQSGNEKMTSIATLIESGAMTFLKKEYTILMIFLVIVTALIGIYLGVHSAICYITGALSSMLCGFIGMKAATKANVRTAQAARDSGQGKALCVAFFGGSVMGMSVASIGLVGVVLLYLWLSEGMTIEALSGFAMGASSIALFARVGGGIYTKAADVGADLVGKVEAGIPEDDPRNPATIADNVGDNVGDTAGMGADIFESYVGSIIATMLIGAGISSSAVYLPLIVATIGLMASVLGILAMVLLKKANPAWALRLAPVIGLAGLFIGAYFVVCAMDFYVFPYALGPFYAIVLGALVGFFIGLSTEYYTAPEFGPVRKIALAGKTGPATKCHCRYGRGNVLLYSSYSFYCFGNLLGQPFCRPLWYWDGGRWYAGHNRGDNDC